LGTVAEALSKRRAGAGDHPDTDFTGSFLSPRMATMGDFTQVGQVAHMGPPARTLTSEN
jgi:hypothetical protein